MSAYMARGVCGKGVYGRGHAWQGVCMWQEGGMHGNGGVHDRGNAQHGACVAGEMTTAVDGTHPTGMHFCYFICEIDFCNIFQQKSRVYVFNGL